MQIINEPRMMLMNNRSSLENRRACHLSNAKRQYEVLLIRNYTYYICLFANWHDALIIPSKIRTYGTYRRLHRSRPYIDIHQTDSVRVRPCIDLRCRMTRAAWGSDLPVITPCGCQSTLVHIAVEQIVSDYMHHVFVST